MNRSMFVVLTVVLLTWSESALAAYFTIPYDADVYIKHLNGSFFTEFGRIDAEDEEIVIFPVRTPGSTEVGLGEFLAGSGLDFYIKTSFGGNFVTYSNVLDERALVAFFDTDNSLGLGGSAIQRTGANTWLLNLDDAASLAFDDDDNDYRVQIRLVAVPEASSLLLGSLGILVISGAGQCVRQRRRCS